MRRLTLGLIALSLVAACVQPLAQVGRLGTLIPKGSVAVSPPTNPSTPNPANGATAVPTSGSISWGGCVGADAWSILGPDPTNNPATTPSNTPGSASQVYSGLSTSMLYRVRVNCSRSGVSATALDFSFTTAAGAPAGTLALSNLGTPQCFLAYGTDAGDFTSSYPVAMDIIGGARHYFQISGNAHLYEFTEPTLKSCDTAIASLGVGTFVRDWGVVTVNGSQQVPGAPGGGSYFRGAYIDPVDKVLWVNWSGAYANLPKNLNSLARIRMNTGDHTLTTLGCYAYPDYMPITGLGTVRIPASFVATNLPAGYNHALLGGVLASATSGNVYGPSMIAIPDPPDNDCSAIDHVISVGVILAQYAPGGNVNGPTCGCDGCSIPPPAGKGLGCDTSSIAITNPQPAQMAYSTYSYQLYPQDWDPKNGHGWYGDHTGWFNPWYNDGVLDASLSLFTQTSGWTSGTIISTTGVGEVIVSTVSANNGFNNRVGEWFTIQTCVPSTDAGCSIENNNHLSIGVIDTINTSTREITYHVISSDMCTSCSHTPIVGGPFSSGPHYKSSIPGWPRSVLRLQTYATSQYASVISGAAPYSPIYTEEGSLYSMGVTTLGDPSTSFGLPGATPNGVVPSQVVSTAIADNSEQKIIVVVKHAQYIGIERSLVILIPVVH